MSLRDEVPGEKRATRLKLSSLSSQIVFARAGFVFIWALFFHLHKEGLEGAGKECDLPYDIILHI